MSSESFVENNKDSILELNKKVSQLITDLNINVSDKLTLSKCLKIVGEINKAIRSIKSFSDSLQKIEGGEKAGIILAVTLHTLNSEEVKAVLSEEQRKYIEDFCQDTETVETIINLVDWVSDSALEQLDSNNDGVVTKKEIEENCRKTCKCCPCIASCWSTFLLCICCSSKSIKYDESKQQEMNQV
jgi:hypothetical protein